MTAHTLIRVSDLKEAEEKWGIPSSYIIGKIEPGMRVEDMTEVINKANESLSGRRLTIKRSCSLLDEILDRCYEDNPYEDDPLRKCLDWHRSSLLLAKEHPLNHHKLYTCYNISEIAPLHILNKKDRNIYYYSGDAVL